MPKQESERKLLTYRQEEAPKEPKKPVKEEKEEHGEPEQEQVPEPESEQLQPQPLQIIGDLLVIFSMSFFLAHFCSSLLNLSFFACMLYAEPG